MSIEALKEKFSPKAEPEKISQPQTTKDNSTTLADHCQNCDGKKFWTDRFKIERCWSCHPPPFAAAVAKTRDCSDPTHDIDENGNEWEWFITTAGREVWQRVDFRDTLPGPDDPDFFEGQ